MDYMTETQMDTFLSVAHHNYTEPKVIRTIKEILKHVRDDVHYQISEVEILKQENLELKQQIKSLSGLMDEVTKLRADTTNIISIIAMQELKTFDVISEISSLNNSLESLNNTENIVLTDVISNNDAKIDSEKTVTPLSKKSPIRPKNNFMVKMENTHLETTNALNVLRFVVQNIGVERIHSSKISYRNVTIGGQKIKCPAVVNASDVYTMNLNTKEKFADLKHECGTPIYTEISDDYFLCSNMPKESCIKYSEKLATIFDVKLEIL